MYERDSLKKSMESQTQSQSTKTVAIQGKCTRPTNNNTQDAKSGKKEFRKKSNSKKPKIHCLGCLENQPNQLAHMNYGGCLYSKD